MDFIQDAEAFATLWNNEFKQGLKEESDFDLYPPLLEAYASYNEIKMNYLRRAKYGSGI